MLVWLIRDGIVLRKLTLNCRVLPQAYQQPLLIHLDAAYDHIIPITHSLLTAKKKTEEYF
jgi:hypothetical protein